MEVEVVFPYEPQHDDELPLEVGDTILDVVPLEKGWYRGTLKDGTTGVFPDNFVKVVSTAAVANGPDNNSKMPGISATKKDGRGKQYRVMYNYVPQHEDELAIMEGQIITLLQEVEEGWWKAVLNGQIGMIPSNFVKEITDDETETHLPVENGHFRSSGSVRSPNQINGDVSDGMKEIRPKPLIGKSYGVTLSDVARERPSAPTKKPLPSPSSAFQPVSQASNEEKKMDQSSSKSDCVHPCATEKDSIQKLENTPPVILKPKPEEPPSSQSLAPPLLPPKKVRELARVVFAYAAEHDDELELVEGDIITILTKDLEDKGWWKGELSGKIGVFPDNFVEIISTEDMQKPPRPEKSPSIHAKPQLTGSANMLSSSSSSSSSESHSVPSYPPPPLPEKGVPPVPPPADRKPIGFSSHISGFGISPEKGSLDLDTDGEKLKHVTHLRPKGPLTRRPPSSAFKENMKVGSPTEGEDMPLNADKPGSVVHQNGLASDSTKVEIPPPVSHSVIPSKSAVPVDAPFDGKKLKRNSLLMKQDDSTKAPIEAPLIKPLKPTRPPVGGVPTEMAAARNPSSKETLPPHPPFYKLPEEVPLKPPRPTPPDSGKHAQLVSTDGNPLSRKDAPSPCAPSQPDAPADHLGALEAKLTKIIEDLTFRVRYLEDKVEEQKRDHIRQLKLLMNELDDEKKKRACTEIEMKRIEKMVQSYV